jgi:LPS sulfotransferase NodH
LLALTLWFYKKLTYKHQKPLVLKSPTHTGKLQTLLRMFPNAKFVHIHRHPHAVVQSTKLMMEKAFAFWCFQEPNITMERIISDYEEVMNAFFTQRDLVPAENYCEMSYEELVADPVATIRRVYEQLALPDFSHVKPSLDTYLASISDYKTNELPPLPENLQHELAERVPRVFDEWNYDLQPGR